MRIPKKLSVTYTSCKPGCTSGWSGIPDGYYFGDIKGNPNGKVTHDIWIKVLCNDPKCPGIKGVHSSVLIKS